MIGPSKSQRFYLALILLTDLGLFIPPLRFIASLMLIGFLPGYFLVERLTLWKNPLFAAVGALGISFLISPLITLPGSLLFRQVTSLLIAISLNLFLLGMVYTLRGRERVAYPEKDHSPWLSPLMILVCSWVFIYVDITKLGPYTEDWSFLLGIIKELSRSMPPKNPEAPFLLLKQPWGFWIPFALIHQLGGLSAWKVMEFLPVILSFTFLGLVYMILFQATKNKEAGLWAIVLLAIGRHSEWVIRGFQGLGWTPDYHTHMPWMFIQCVTGYTFLWGFYTLPGLLPPLLAFFFFIRYQQEKQKIDLYFSLGACSIAPFFHPVYYLGFLSGFSVILLFQWLRRKWDPRLLFYYLTFLPYYLAYYLYFHPALPKDPIYQFFLGKSYLINALWYYFGLNGIAIPFAVLAVFISPEARLWFLPFSFIFTTFCLLGWSGVNHGTYFLLQDGLYLSLLSAIGLSHLRIMNKGVRLVIYLLVLGIILPPYLHQISFSIRNGWAGGGSVEQEIVGEFIRSHTASNSIFVTLPDSLYSVDTVEGRGERKVVLGLLTHLDRYEPITSIKAWDQEVKTFFSTTDFEKREDFIRKYQANYIFLGPDENNYMREHQRDLELFKKPYLSIYKNTDLEILKTGLKP